MVVEIGGPICCPKNERASDFNIGPNFEGVQSTNKLLSQTLSCHRKKAFGHLTKPTNVVLFSSLPMAVDCRWRSLLHELTQATKTIGPTVVMELGLRCFIFFYFDILAKFFFETGILHLVSLGFLGGGGLNCFFYMIFFV